MSPQRLFTLTLSCNNRLGIVHAVSKLLVECDCNITDSSQFDDEESGRFFMRVSFSPLGAFQSEEFKARFSTIALSFGMSWNLHDRTIAPKAMLMVSKLDHCFVDLLYRRSIGELKIDVPVIVSNHADAEPIAARYGIPFHLLSITPDTKRAQEQKLIELIDDFDIELVVLARYMQILSPELCASLPQRVINIHHSFLPSFKGARPYHQAHTRGVKLIGATAHFVTSDLDEGPIIEQDVVRVRHDQSAAELVAIGRDIERVVLARAVRMFSERRILMNGAKTVVFN